MSRNEQNIAERFAKDTVNHVLEIRHDDGVYRHMRYGRPGDSCMAVYITTAPGILTYSGDMGCFVFERMTDMMQFFRRGIESIDYHYWHSKLIAHDSREGSEEYSRRKFKEALLSYVPHIEDPETKKEVLEGIESIMATYDDKGHEVAYSEAYEFRVG